MIGMNTGTGRVRHSLFFVLFVFVLGIRQSWLMNPWRARSYHLYFSVAYESAEAIRERLQKEERDRAVTDRLPLRQKPLFFPVGVLIRYHFVPRDDDSADNAAAAATGTGNPTQTVIDVFAVDELLALVLDYSDESSFGTRSTLTCALEPLGTRSRDYRAPPAPEPVAMRSYDPVRKVYTNTVALRQALVEWCADGFERGGLLDRYDANEQDTDGDNIEWARTLIVRTKAYRAEKQKLSASAASAVSASGADAVAVVDPTVAVAIPSPAPAPVTLSRSEIERCIIDRYYRCPEQLGSIRLNSLCDDVSRYHRELVADAMQTRITKYNEQQGVVLSDL